MIAEIFTTLLVGENALHTQFLWDKLHDATLDAGGQFRAGLKPASVRGALGAVDLALWDIKAKALGVPVHELLGGPTRDKVRLYWTHFGTYRISHSDHLGTPPIRSLEDIAELARGVVEKGYTALKTNALLVGERSQVISAGFGGGYGSTDRNLGRAELRQVEALIRTIRDAVGDDIDEPGQVIEQVGGPVAAGPYRVRPFQLVKLTPGTQIFTDEHR